MNIRPANEYDIDSISQVYAHCFPNEKSHRLWVTSSFKSFPRSVYYVLEQQGIIKGYILWCVKNGFRESTIVELEQLAVDSQYSGKGLGRKLIVSSFEQFKQHVLDTGHKVGAVMVTTTEGNYAEKLYISTLNVSKAAVLAGYASGDEVILYNNSIET
jgi:ribosomal protein S18 acetylase RimI-like enzyme